MGKPRVLLVNPAVFDFAAYDFWLKPYGLLSVAGRLRGRAELFLYDYLDRLHPDAPKIREDGKPLREDDWGRGEFHKESCPAPPQLPEIHRKYWRFGTPRHCFQEYLKRNAPFDFVLVQTVMTYWYPGVAEVIEDIREYCPGAKIILGGVYATLCTAHARNLGADYVLEGRVLDPLWTYMGITPKDDGLPYWDAYENLSAGVLKLADGCPFKCTYCSVPQVYPTFHMRPMERTLAELDALVNRGVRDIVFYDDALLFQPDKILMPFLEAVLRRGYNLNFHTPNALNARFVDTELASLMLRAGFKVLYLGFESSEYEWQKKTGGKVYSHELRRAVENLLAAGADLANLNAYLIIGHPQSAGQNVHDSMRFAHDCGLRVMLSEFSPIPGTPDGEACRQWVNLDEPLYHNKTLFPQIYLGEEKVSAMKSLCRDLNNALKLSRTA